MLSHGLKQSDRLVLEKPNISIGYIESRIKGKKEEGVSVKEIWIKDGEDLIQINF